MRIRTSVASVWVDDTPACPASSPSVPSASPALPPAPKTAAQVRWATRAYAGRLGRYVAVRLKGDVLEVAVVQPHTPLRWVRAATALTTAEANSWLAWGFAS
jgi:hypothetical protein